MYTLQYFSYKKRLEIRIHMCICLFVHRETLERHAKDPEACLPVGVGAGGGFTVGGKGLQCMHK